MGVFKIKCSLGLLQMDTVVHDIEKHIADFYCLGISDFEGLYADDVHVFVDFGHEPVYGLRLKKDTPGKKSVEVLDSDYEPLEADTLILKKRIMEMLENYSMERGEDGNHSYSIAEELAKERYYHRKYGI